jgi:hypothetical protein
MHTYEKPPGSRNRGSNTTGVIAVICLFAALFATWAVVRTGAHVATSPSVTTGIAQSGRVQ